MDVTAAATVCAVRGHGEHGVILRAMTADHGLLVGYVRGGKSRVMRPILIPGNVIAGRWHGRGDAQLPSLTAELLHSRAALMQEPLPAAAIDWITALTAAALPEAQAFPAVDATLGAVLDAVEHAAAARDWAGVLARYELLLLQYLGFGLSLDQCVVTGARDDLAYVSPRSAAAVSASAAKGREHQLLPLPAFIRSGEGATLAQAMDGLRLSGHFIEHRLFERRRESLMATRARLMDRLQRAIA